MQVDVIWKDDSSNLLALRKCLRQALTHIGALPSWQEWRIGSKVVPPQFRKHKSLTILVNGHPVFEHREQMPVAAEHLPPVELLATRIKETAALPSRLKPVSRLSLILSFIPALLLALLPKCPFCWAAYMSLFSTLGIGTIPYQPWLLPVMVALLFINLGVLLYSAPHRNGYLPFYLSLAGALVIVICKFWLDLNTITYIGIGMIFIASIWHSLPPHAIARLGSVAKTV